MLRITAIVAGLLGCACTPAPAPMAASEAGEHLALFAAGAGQDVCTPEGRAVLRGAVRGYGAELERAGVTWPELREGEALRRTELAVAVAFAAGLLESSDFRSEARGAVSQFAFTQWPHLRDMRAAARVACAQALELQGAALHLAGELDRYRRLNAYAEAGRTDPARLARQRERLERAEAHLQALAAVVQAEIAAARSR